MAVPDTNAFTLVNVCDELGLIGANRNLVQCFASADPAQFDPAYEGSKDRLLNFRNYGAFTPPLIVDPTSFQLGNSHPSQVVTVTTQAPSWNAVILIGGAWMQVVNGSGSQNGNFTVNYTDPPNQGRLGVVRVTTNLGDFVDISVQEIA